MGKWNAQFLSQAHQRVLQLIHLGFILSSFIVFYQTLQTNIKICQSQFSKIPLFSCLMSQERRIALEKSLLEIVNEAMKHP